MTPREQIIGRLSFPVTADGGVMRIKQKIARMNDLPRWDGVLKELEKLPKDLLRAWVEDIP